MAEAQNRDRTGAPGSDPVCTSCHNGSTSASASFEVVDAATQEAATAYTPGQEYLVRMVIAGGEANSVYGMQGTVVLADGSNAGPQRPFRQCPTRRRGRTSHRGAQRLERIQRLKSNWTAPLRTGNADFYMSAMESNGNGSTNGDGYLQRPCPCRKWPTLQAPTAWPWLPLQIGPALCPSEKCGLGRPPKRDV